MNTKVVGIAKNLLSWKTKRKLLVIAIDDYGNIRLDSRQARESLDNAGIPVRNIFDAYDTLETRPDLEALFEVLDAQKDINGRPACFTPFSMPCNLDFERIEASGYETFYNENLPESFEKMAARYPQEYLGAWSLWNEGIEKGFLKPEYHGREHLNLRVFLEKIISKDREVLTALQNRSYTSISASGYPTISYTAAFEFWDFEENERLAGILADGISRFEQVFGRKPKVFNPPGGREHHILHQTLIKQGIFGIESTFLKQEHQGHGKFKKEINYTGKKTSDGIIIQVRNAVFEPIDGAFFDENRAFRDVSLAFSMNAPAIISSHRVNFCGLIEPKIRQTNLQKLDILLKRIKQAFPEVEFVSSGELYSLMNPNEQ